MADLQTHEIIKITSEEDAWRVLEDALNDTFDYDVEIVFDNWPSLEIKLDDKAYDSSLTAKNMEGLIELQKSVYRIFAQVEHGDLNAANLKKDEKDKLQIVFKVSPGCSDILAELKDALNVFAKGMVSKMEPRHYIITILGVSVIIASTVCYKGHLQQQQDIRLAEIAYQEKELDFKERKYASDAEFEKLELLASAFGVEPQLEPIKESADESRTALLKSVSNADKISIAGVESVEGKTLNKILKKTKSTSVEDRLDGIFRIIKVDTSSVDFFKLKFRKLDDGTEITAKINDSDVIKRKMQEILQDAEWKKKPVLLQMNIKRNKGVIVDATVLRAETAPDSLLETLDKGYTDIEVRYSRRYGFQYDLPEIEEDADESSIDRGLSEES